MVVLGKQMNDRGDGDAGHDAHALQHVRLRLEQKAAVVGCRQLCSVARVEWSVAHCQLAVQRVTDAQVAEMAAMEAQARVVRLTCLG